MNTDPAHLILDMLSSGQLTLLQKMIRASRDLIGPAEDIGNVHAEYINAQAQLIFDTITWPDAISIDEGAEIIRQAITREISFWAMLGLLLDPDSDDVTQP